MRRFFLSLAAALAATLALLPAGAASAAVGPRYYLALGDSLSQGIQPNAAGATVNTNQGYADQLYRIERAHILGLRLVKLGCGGDTTTSMLTGKGNAAAAASLHCDRAGGSQLAAAERFLRAHHKPERYRSSRSTSAPMTSTAALRAARSTSPALRRASP
jgi:hypothetical protein